jgi:hypothetical protein
MELGGYELHKACEGLSAFYLLLGVVLCSLLSFLFQKISERFFF